RQDPDRSNLAAASAHPQAYAAGRPDTGSSLSGGSGAVASSGSASMTPGAGLNATCTMKPSTGIAGTSVASASTGSPIAAATALPASPPPICRNPMSADAAPALRANGAIASVLRDGRTNARPNANTATGAITVNSVASATCSTIAVRAAAASTMPNP